MKIGIFTDTYLPDINGVTTSIATIEAELRKLGHQVLVVAPSHELKYEISPEKNTWRLPSLRFYGEKRFRFVIPYLSPKGFKQIPLDVIHTQTPFPIGFTGLRLAKKRHLRAIHTYHTRYPEYKHYLKMPNFMIEIVGGQIMAAIIRFLNRHDAIIAPSLGIKRELESFGVKKPITVIPTGVNIQRILSLPNQKDIDDLSKKYNINPEDEIVIFTSRLAKEKNIEFLLDSMKIIFDKRPRSRFIIIGDGDHKKVLEKYAAQMGFNERILFTGFLRHEEIFSLYKLAKVFVFSSITETQGLVLLEAMASNLPVVALKATGIDDLLETNQGGFMIEKKELSAFADAVINLLENDDLRKTKSAEAYKRAEDFSIEKTIKMLVEVYQGSTNSVN